MIESARKGAVSETKVSAVLTEKGYLVFTPVSDHSPYDLIVDTGELYRVECKYGRCKEDETGEFVRFNTESNGESYTDRVDYVAVYAPKYSEIYYIPSDELPAGHMTLRPPSVETKRCIRTERFKCIPF
jgi:hypothetical protein